MIRIFIIIIAAAIILPLAYFQFKETALPKKMTVAGTIIAAAFISTFLQFLEFAFYLALLAIIAISMIGAIAFAKIDEMEKGEKLRMAEEKKQQKQTAMALRTTFIEGSEPAMESGKSLYEEAAPKKKTFAMQTIGVGGEEN